MNTRLLNQRHISLPTIHRVMSVARFFAQMEQGAYALTDPAQSAVIVVRDEQPVYAAVLATSKTDGGYFVLALNLSTLLIERRKLSPADLVRTCPNILTEAERRAWVGTLDVWQ